MQGMKERKEDGVKDKNDKLLQQVKKFERKNKKLKKKVKETLLAQLSSGLNGGGAPQASLENLMMMGGNDAFDDSDDDSDFDHEEDL